MQMMDGQPAPYYDKVPLRFADGDESIFREVGARVVPGAIVRRGAHLGRDVVLMPSFVHIGAYVGAGTMVDTWATVGRSEEHTSELQSPMRSSYAVCCWRQKNHNIRTTYYNYHTCTTYYRTQS